MFNYCDKCTSFYYVIIIFYFNNDTFFISIVDQRMKILTNANNLDYPQRRFIKVYYHVSVKLKYGECRSVAEFGDNSANQTKFAA